MPIVTVGDSDNPRFELKTAPPDGYVVLRRLTYGESLAREAMMTKFTVDGNASSKEFLGDVKIDQEGVALFDFAHCIVEHNLQEAGTERLLNFKNAADVKKLSKSVGKEIGDLIDSLNNFEESAEVKNS
jgi:hypothetical protein